MGHGLALVLFAMVIVDGFSDEFSFRCGDVVSLIFDVETLIWMDPDTETIDTKEVEPIPRFGRVY